jgi:hypothetical protein
MRSVTLVLCAGLLFAAVGCNKNENNESAYLQQKAKPLVAFFPIFDRTENAGVSWNLSDELTTGVQRKLAQKGDFSFVANEQVRAMTKKIVGERDPFAADVSWMKRQFKGAEFVVFSEVLEHEEVPVSYINVQSSPANLNMSVKVRIVDLRAENPRIVLQEILHESYHIPKQFTKENFRQIAWGKENYHVSPVGIAHSKLIKEIASRIDDYVSLAAGR